MDSVARTKVKTTNARRAVNSATKRAKKSAKSSVSRTAVNQKAAQAIKRAEDALWGVGVPPHFLLQELREALLLRCLKEAAGNYAAAAAMFGPSRQSVQQYANSPLRDARWKPYQQNRRKRRESRV